MKKILKAWLRKNALTDSPNNYTAIPESNGSKGPGDIIDQMVSEGMELKRETAIAIISRYNRTVSDMVVSGYNVNTGLVYMRPVIKGVFYGKTWNPELNSVYVLIKQGAFLRAAIAETTVEILGEHADPLEIFSLTDSTTGKTDGTLSKGRNAELKGSYLKIIGENPDCGITFRHTGTGAVTKLSANDIVLNEPARLLIFIPATLEADEYELTVTTQFTGGGSILKQPRSVTFGLPVVITP